MKKDDFPVVGDGQPWCRGLEPQKLAGNWDGLSWGNAHSCPGAGPASRGPCLLLFLRAWEKDLLAQERNVFPRKSCVQGLLPDTDRWVHPMAILALCEHVIACTFVYLYASTPLSHELSPAGLQRFHSWSRRRIQLQMPQQ